MMTYFHRKFCSLVEENFIDHASVVSLNYFFK